MYPGIILFLQFVRPSPTRPTFTRFFDFDGNEVYSIDVSNSTAASYLPERAVLFTMPESFDLVEKLEYYILMESGVARGLEFCGPESPAIWDPYFWRFRIST